MLIRAQIYQEIDERIDFYDGYFGLDSGGIKTAKKPASLEEWLNLMRVTVQKGLGFYQDSNALPTFLTLGAYCVMCMRDCGYVRPGIGVIECYAGRSLIYAAIDAELVTHRPRTVDGYALLVTYHLRRAVYDWANDKDSYALDAIRKLAAVCVACLEQHG